MSDFEHTSTTRPETSCEPIPAFGSPFDAIRRVRADGTEFWSARDLRPLMGYARWDAFETPIRRAMKTAENQGMNVATLFLRSQKLAGERQQGGGNAAQDFELARYAAYLVAMNGDPNIPEVAAAQHYFAVRTREAETAQPALNGPLSDDEIVHRALEISARRVEVLTAENKALTAAIERDAPLIAKAQAHTGSTDSVSRQVFARKVQYWGHQHGIKILHEDVYHLMRSKGMLVCSPHRQDRNHATAKAITNGWAYTSETTTDGGLEVYTTRILPEGQDMVWKWVVEYVNTYNTLNPRAKIDRTVRNPERVRGRDPFKVAISPA